MSNRPTAIWASVATAALLAVCASARGGAERPEASPLAAVYASDLDGSWALYGVSLSTGRRERFARLTRTAAQKRSFEEYSLDSIRWSPDGTRLALTLLSRIDVVDVRTGRRTTAAQHVDAVLADPAWSPDGKRLAFIADDDVAVVDLTQGRGMKRLARKRGASSPVWSPDGKAIAYVVSGVGVETVFLDRGVARGLVRAQDASEPRWSPDGQWVSYTRRFERGIYVIRPDGSGRRRVGKVDGFRDTDVSAWSPTGSKLAFVCPRGICIADPGARSRVRVVAARRNGERLMAPVWDQRGERLLFLRGGTEYGPDYPDVWMANARSGTDRPLTWGYVEGARAAAPAWSTITVARGVRHAPPATARVRVRDVMNGVGAVTSLDAGRGGIAWIEQRGAEAAVFTTTPRQLRRRRVWPVDRPFGPWVGHVAVGRGRVHWARDAGTSREAEWILADAPFAGGRPDEVGMPDGGWYDVRTLAGDGREVVAGVETACARGGSSACHEAWRYDGGAWRRIGAGPGSPYRATVDGAAVAIHVQGGVRVYTFDGGSRTIAVPGAADALIHDGDVFVLAPRGLLLRVPLSAGRRRGSWRLAVTAAGVAALEDADGRHVAYSVGGTLHVLRMRDGTDIALRAPSAAPPVYARFTPTGLVYSYGVIGSRTPARLAVVPLQSLGRAFDSGRSAD